jgi:hypothetical protein
MVIVNGVVVLEKGLFTGEYPGKPLRKVIVKSSPARLENGG